MKQFLRIFIFISIFGQFAFGSSLIETPNHTFVIGSDGKIYKRSETAYDNEPEVNFRALPGNQLPNGMRAQDISIKFLRVPPMYPQSYVISAIGNDGLIYKTEIIDDDESSLSFTLAPHQLPSGVEVHSARLSTLPQVQAPPVSASAPAVVTTSAATPTSANKR